MNRIFPAPVLGLALAVLLTACVGATSELARQLQADPAAEGPEAARSIHADRTFITYNSFHGTQIEYHGTDGKAHLWYPGNFSGVPSNWKIEYDVRSRSHDICWQYPVRSYNPVTRQRGGRFDCQPNRFYLAGVTQILAGDPFNLASGRIPFRLSKERHDAEALARMARIPPNRIRTIYKAD
ncbi:hypothetical protein [Jannaschia marina]|uniref:hypothetical protein n=1 Tax=Jannaschia marina TaxID=2741674 RepID=UPI0015C77AE7|nr:hypothetical protein [Jannaschia marina]